MKTKAAFFLVAIILLVWLFVLLRPKSEKSDTEIKTDDSRVTVTKSNNNVSNSPETSSSSFELVVKNRDLVQGFNSLKVIVGDHVTIRITVDENEELHLHGYDKSLEIKKNIPGEMSFTADKTGRFPFELEKSKMELGVLEVLPK